MEKKEPNNGDMIAQIQKECDSNTAQTYIMLNGGRVYGTLKKPDDFLDLKFNLMRIVLEKTDNYESQYKTFFESTDKVQLEKNKKMIDEIDLLGKTNKNGYDILSQRKLIWIYGYTSRIEFDNSAKIDVSNILNGLNSEQNKEKKVEVDKDHGFIKMCKGIYKLYGGKLDPEEMYEYGRMFSEFTNSCFTESKSAKTVLQNIQRLECDDEEFKGFQAQLKDWIFNGEKGTFVSANADDLSVEEDLEYGDTNKDNLIGSEEKKISVMKLFLLITTVVFLAAVIFFAINVILEFLVITPTSAIVLATFTITAFLISLAISIKNDVINKPQFFSGKKSFIDLYQDKEAIPRKNEYINEKDRNDK